jgi:hypothetical protein
MASQADFSREALARFIDYVVEKALVNPSTAQGWRVATTKVLSDLSPEEKEDVRRIDLDATFRAFLHRNPDRLSPASVGEYRRRVQRAVEEFVTWIEDPGAYGNRSAAWAARTDRRTRSGSRSRGAAVSPAAGVRPERPKDGGSIALDFPLRPEFLAQVVVPRDLTVDEARRMGAFLLTLAPEFRPEGAPPF